MTGYPSLKEALCLWHDSVSGMLEWAPDTPVREYIFHSVGIAEAAALIASSCGLDADKAYVLGLLHDYGKKQKQRDSGISHIIFGYEYMMAKGWFDVAKICLTHSFPEKDFNIDDYPSYPLADILRAKEIIAKLDYDDYDRLIQLCDIFFEGTRKISYKERIACIRQRYGLTKEQVSVLELKAAENKAYFEAKCGQNIYELLGIKE